MIIIIRGSCIITGGGAPRHAVVIRLLCYFDVYVYDY